MFQLPKDGQPDAGLTKDYANSGLHRFKKPGSKNYQNIYPPSATLHLSNIPSQVEEEDLRKAFQAINLTVQVHHSACDNRLLAVVVRVSKGAALGRLFTSNMLGFQFPTGSEAAISHNLYRQTCDLV